MEHYNTETKEKQFSNYRRICSVDKLEEIIVEFKKLQNNRKLHCVFRGVNEAKYKLFNSAQRKWQNWDLSKIGIPYKDRINCLLFSCYNSLLPRYYKRLGISVNDWLYLSFLQHYNAPSPFLDFSKDFKAALFFACYNVQSYGTTENELDNYMSIYYFKFVDAAQQIDSLKNIAETLTKQHNINDEHFYEKLSFDMVMKDRDVIFVPSYSNIMKVGKKKNQLILATANLRSTSQEGEFVCNGTENKPLEMLFREHGAELYCVDIHKGLCNYMIQNYLDGSIENARKKYFPQETDISSYATLSFMNGINR